MISHFKQKKNKTSNPTNIIEAAKEGLENKDHESLVFVTEDLISLAAANKGQGLGQVLLVLGKAFACAGEDYMPQAKLAFLGAARFSTSGSKTEDRAISNLSELFGISPFSSLRGQNPLTETLNRLQEEPPPPMPSRGAIQTFLEKYAKNFE